MADERRAERFLALACLTYDGDDHPSRRAEASELLAADPTLVSADVRVAAAVGDVDAVRAHVTADPASASRAAGERGWTPLLHLTYSRVPQQDPLGTAVALLEAGADADASFLWQGQEPRFTALTGCFGEGESGPGRQPRHPFGEELAGLLLDHGASPDDEQTLYNRMFGRDDSHLTLLLGRGLGRSAGSARPVQQQVDWARDHGLTDRLALLAEHGFDGCPPSDPSPWRRRRREVPLDRVGTPAAVTAAAREGVDLDALVDGRTLLHQAAWVGDVEMVEALLSAGASPDVVDDEHGTTPLGWAEWGCADATAALLRPVTGRPGDGPG